MRTSSNPVFRDLPAMSGGGYATFDTSARGGYAGGPPARTDADRRPMTVDDVVTKTGITLAVLVAAGAVTWAADLAWLALPAALVGFVLALVIIFKQLISPPLILTYAALEGVFLGAVSMVYGQYYDNGIVVQAVIGTAGVFGGMLVVYKTGAIRVTPKLTKWLVGALGGVVVLMLVNMIAALIGGGDGLGLRTPTPLGILFSLVCIGIAAFFFLLDFDAADQAIRAGAPAKMAWRVAFGLTLTLVWLYLEILRLLSYFRE